MNIKHIVLSGGAYNGLSTFGCIKTLHEKNIYNINNIENIYGTSVGAIIGAILCITPNLENVHDYILNRPWQKDIIITPEMIFESITKKGIMDKMFMHVIFDKLLKSVNLSPLITLKEFYEYSKIKLHIFTIDVNSFEIIKMSYETRPKIKLIDALYMSCSIPFVFQPIVAENKCYIDGGCLCNYPLGYCIENVVDKDTILGIKLDFIYDDKNIITETTNIFYYGFYLFDKLVLQQQQQNIVIKNQITIPCQSLNAKKGWDCIIKKEERKKYIEKGIEIAENFVKNIKES